MGEEDRVPTETKQNRSGSTPNQERPIPAYLNNDQ